MSDVIKISPVVFAVGNDYKIFVPVSVPTLMWIKVGDECYYDHSNGVLRSDVTVHKITVPARELDKEKKYTVAYRTVEERKPYFSKTGEIEEISYVFNPLPEKNYRIYHISDAHGMVDAPVAAAKIFEKEAGRIDLLVLNGDVIDHSGDVKNFDTIYSIASLVTKGEVPVIFSRGNHDTRGIHAEKIADYTPTRNGYSYFSFRLGSLWGLVLDCGEDKLDTHEEYGNTICCHAFRREETRYIESIIANAKNEYESEGIEKKIIIAHSPFTHKYRPPFDIENEIYDYWTKLLSESIKPDLMMCGHTHTLSVSIPGDELDARRQPCKVVVAAVPNIKENHFIGGGFVFDNNSCELIYSSDKEIKRKTVL